MLSLTPRGQWIKGSIKLLALAAVRFISYHIYAASAGFRDEDPLSDLVNGQPKLIALLSPKLDIESRTIGNWKSLATQFEIPQKITEQFGMRGSGPTGALFLHVQTDENLRHLTMGQLFEHFRVMQRNDLVALLKKLGFEGW